jgi:dTDP-4-amino-4,6-dideoxygalactose transaminase
MKPIPLLIPDMPDADAILPYLRKIDAARWYTNFGPLVTDLEKVLARTLGDPAPFVATVANCTAGLELALTAMPFSPGAKVLVPALTFVASATAALRSGLTPVFSDVGKDSWLLTPEIARAALTRHEIACVMPVATFGCPHPTAQWDRFTRDTGIPVVIDAAGAFGNQAIGEGTSVVFSFHATKSFGMGEGGMVASRNKAHIERVRQLTNFGIDVSRGISSCTGTNAKMSEYHAAVGHAALETWPDRQLFRRSLLSRYNAALQKNCPAIALQARPADGVYTIMQVLLPEGVESGVVAARLHSLGIETRRWYLPLLGMHPAFAGCPVDGELVVLQSIAPRMLGLPFHTDLSQDDIERISLALSEAINAPR